MIRVFRRLVSNERGALLVMAAASMVAIISMAALAIDVGMLYSARTEAQRVADLSALAGAGSLLQSPNEPNGARAIAIDYASRNLIMHDSAVVQTGDVVIDLNAQTVTVTVHRTRARGAGVSTLFAQVFGVNEVDVVASATAQVWQTTDINCPLPVAMPDRWNEAGGPGNDALDFNPELGDSYVPWAVPGTDPIQTNSNFTGYSSQDVGTQVKIKSNGAGGDMNPSWYYPWRPPGQAGGSDYRENIRGCTDPTINYQVGQVVDAEPGSMSGPTMQGFKDLIDQDPDARWNNHLNCVTDATNAYSSDAATCRGSPRTRTMPMFNPSDQPEPGSKPFEFSNFVGVFVERIEGNSVYVRWAGFRGVTPTAPASPGSSPVFKVIRLIG